MYFTPFEKRINIGRKDRKHIVFYFLMKEAKYFADATGIDTFAVVIGTAHGIYPEPMKACGDVVEEKIRLFNSNDKVKYYYE